MILVPCLHCYTALRIRGMPEEVDPLVGRESEFWPDRYACVGCGRACSGVLEVEADPEAVRKMKVRELTPAEALAALHGLGTPDEMACDPETVREAFRKPIKRVSGRRIAGTQRFAIHFVEFEDGTRLYLAASGAEAAVYRIARPMKYAEADVGD